MSTGVTQQYLCNLCGHTVTLTPSSTASHLICFNCTSNSFQLLQNPNPTDNSADFMAQSDDHAEDIGNDAEADLEESLLDLMVHRFLPNPNRNRSPPALPTRSPPPLPSVTISAVMVADGTVSECAVCLESFCVGDVAKEFPCNHVYHGECIFPWLEMHNFCPLCRFELPTHDVEHENRGRDGMESSAGGLLQNVESSVGEVGTWEEGSNRGGGDTYTDTGGSAEAE